MTRTRKLLNKATVGYVMLAIGTVYAVHGNSTAIHDSKERGQVTRGIICSILTQSDEQGIRLEPTEAKVLHVSLPLLAKFEQGQLKITAQYRKELAPSTPHSACEHGVTVLKGP